MSKRGNGEGTIGLYGGRWVGRVTLPDGRRKALYGKSFEEVRRQVTAAQRDADLGQLPTADKITVQQFLNRWLADWVKRRNRPSTYRSYDGHVRLHLVPAFGNIKLARLTPQHVEALLSHLVDDGLSPATATRVRATLRAALQRAVKQGLVTRNSAALADAPPVQRKPVRPISPEDARRLLAAISGHPLEALYVLALGTGLRQGEILGLRWEDLDLKEGTLAVRNALQRVDGHLVLVPPKSDRSVRSLPLPSVVLSAIRGHRERQLFEANGFGDDWNREGFVFITGTGRPLDGSNLTRQFHSLLLANGLPRMRFHDLRHACASFLLAAGESLRVVMEQLGHSQIGLTMNTYAHVMPQALEAAAEKMDRMLSQPVVHETGFRGGT